MKKTNRFAATALATLMIGSTAAMSAQAAAIAGTVTAGDQLPIVKNITGNIVPKANFTFTITPGTAEGDIKSGVALDNNTVTTEFVEGGDKSQKTAFDFSGVDFKTPGVYRYEVTETAGSVTGMTYDETKYIVDVTVLNDDGKNVVSYFVAKKEGSDDKAPIEFENTAASYGLTVKKEVKGNMGDRNEDFTFQLTVDACEGYTTFSAKTSAADGSTLVEEDLTLGTAYEFTLKHDEKFTVANLPNGVSYTLVETGAEDYTTAINDVQGKTATGEIKDANVELLVVNEKNTDVPTGIILDVAPYAFALLAAAGAGALVLFKKRKAVK